MVKRQLITFKLTLSQFATVLSHDRGGTGILVVVALAGLIVIGLWGLYGDLFLSNLVVVAVAEVLIVLYAGSLTLIAARLVRSHDRWQVESALTLRDLLSEGGSGNVQAGSPFSARQLGLRLEQEIRRCKEYGTSLSVVAVRLELPGRSPSHAIFSQANFEMAELVTLHREALISPTPLGMFEYAFCLPNCERRAAQAITAFIAHSLSRYHCSFGIAVYPDDGEEGNALIQLATAQCGMLQSSAA